MYDNNELRADLRRLSQDKGEYIETKQENRILAIKESNTKLVTISRLQWLISFLLPTQRSAVEKKKQHIHVVFNGLISVLHRLEDKLAPSAETGPPGISALQFSIAESKIS